MADWVEAKTPPPIKHERDNGEPDISDTVQLYNQHSNDYGYGHYCENGTWENYGGDYDFMHIEVPTHWRPLDGPR